MDLVIDLKVQPAKGKDALNYPFQFPTCLLECGGFSEYKFAFEAGQTSEEMLIHKPLRSADCWHSREAHARSRSSLALLLGAK